MAKADDRTTTDEGGYKQIAVRLPVEFFDRLERHLARMKAAAPGVDLKRADAIRSLLAGALDAAEGSPPR